MTPLAQRRRLRLRRAAALVGTRIATPEQREALVAAALTRAELARAS